MRVTITCSGGPKQARDYAQVVTALQDQKTVNQQILARSPYPTK